MKKPLFMVLAAQFMAAGAWAEPPDFDASLRSVLAQVQESGKASEERRDNQGEWWKPLEAQQEALKKMRDVVEPAILVVSRSKGWGAGFIFDTSGLVMTSNHVVEGVEEVTVNSDHISETKAKVVARAPQRDIAILQLEGERRDWPTLKFADYSQVQRLQLVYAFGNPLNFGISSHQGLVQRCDNNKISPFAVCLQSSLSFGPGDSGGPTVNIQGEVVGMNAMIPQNARDMSFSIAGNVLQKAVAEYHKDKDLADYGIDADFAVVPQRDGSARLVVQSAPQNSGLRQGDVVASVDGADLPQTPSAFEELQKAAFAKGKGGKMSLKIVRAEAQADGSVQELEEEIELPMEKLSRRPNMEIHRAPHPFFFFGG